MESDLKLIAYTWFGFTWCLKWTVIMESGGAIDNTDYMNIWIIWFRTQLKCYTYKTINKIICIFK